MFMYKKIFRKYQLLDILILMDYCLTYSGKYFMHIQDHSVLMKEACFVLSRHTETEFLRAISRKQQTAGRHATLPRQIILFLG